VIHLDVDRSTVWNAHILQKRRSSSTQEGIQMRRAVKIFRLIAGGLLVAIPAVASCQIVNFDPPDGTETQPAAINASGTIVGRYQEIDGDGVQPGFIRDAGGNFTALYGPVPDTTQTVPVSINDAGEITGWYSVGATVHGFSLDAEGNYTSFDPPGSIATTPFSINSAGEISGNYSTSGAGGDVGFLRDTSGNFVTFGGPGSCGDAVINAFVSASGEVAGTCSFHSGRFYTFFIRAADGILTQYGNPFGGTVIYVQSINDRDVLVGYYTDTAGTVHGFWGNAAGLHSFDYPGATSTAATAINFTGTVTGLYYDANSASHGFVRDQAGNFTSFDDPNAGIKVSQGTRPAAINLSGQTTGQFNGPNGVAHGFLRK
jgi:hypothetical protein